MFYSYVWIKADQALAFILLSSGEQELSVFPCFHSTKVAGVRAPPCRLHLEQSRSPGTLTPARFSSVPLTCSFHVSPGWHTRFPTDITFLLENVRD